MDAWVCPAARLWLQPKPNGMKVYKLDGAAMRNLQDYYLPGLFSDVSVNIEGNMAMLQVKDVLGILGLSK